MWAFLWAATATAADAAASPSKALSGFVDVNGYYDSRQAADININILANLPHRFQYFSLTNQFHSTGTDGVADLDSLYTEQNLRWAPHADVPVDVTAQWVGRSGPGNDAIRAGLRWRLHGTSGLKRLLGHVGLRYAITWHLYELPISGSTNGWHLQFEHVYRLSVAPQQLRDRVYIGGFLDHNLWAGAPTRRDVSRIVTEHQLGVRVVGGLHIVAEFRVNQYAERPVGLGLGFEYLLRFRHVDWVDRNGT